MHSFEQIWTKGKKSLGGELLTSPSYAPAIEGMPQCVPILVQVVAMVGVKHEPAANPYRDVLIRVLVERLFPPLWMDFQKPGRRLNYH